MRANTRHSPTSASANLRLGLLASAAMLIATPSLAQQARPAPAAPAARTPTAQRPANALDELTDEAYEVETLIVEGTREGSAIGDIPPEVQLTPADIQAYGVSSISELVDALSPQLGATGGGGGGPGGGGGGGRPTILINGARVSSFNEIRDLPTEAILRAEILPEEVALKYGYRADQRVLNLVLRPYFQSRSAEGGYKVSTEGGGGDTADLRANLLTIQLQNRFMVDGRVSSQSPLLESARSFASPRSDANFRTLISDQQSASLNAVLSRPLGNGVSGTLNGTLDGTETKSKLGVNTLAGGPLLRDSKSLTSHLGGGATGGFKGWSWTTTANADRTNSKSTTQRVNNGVGFNDTANSTSTSADAQLVLNGRLFHMPAGYVNSTVRLGASTLRFDSDAVRAGVPSSTKLGRDGGNGQVNLDVPLTSVRNGVFDKIGDLSLNFNGAVEHLSDFGELTTVGYGLNWGPTARIRVLASVTIDDNAPSVQQLGNPVQVTPGVQAYDFATNQTVVISRTDGGNPNLGAETRHQMRLSLNARPFTKYDFNFTANYNRTRTEGVISSFPTASTQIENAFPARFVRDASGRLVSIDARPVNFDRRETQELRYGFTFRKPLGPQPPQGGGRGGAAGQGGGFRGQGGAAGGAPGQGFQGRGQGGPAQAGPGAPGAGQPGRVGQAPQGQAPQGQALQGQAPQGGQGFRAQGAAGQGGPGQGGQGFRGQGGGQGGQRPQGQAPQAPGAPAQAAPNPDGAAAASTTAQGGQRPAGQRPAGAAAAQGPGGPQAGQGQQRGAGGNPLAAILGGAGGEGGGPPPGVGFGGPPGGGAGGFGGGFGGPPGGGFGGGPGGGPGGGGPGGGGFGGPGGGGGGGGRGGNIQIGLYHTIRFEDEITIRSGVPKLDLLDGASIGQGGGTPRNQLDAQANLNRNGLGLAVNARWTQGTKLRGGTQDLDFSAMTTVNLRLFAELRQQPWFRDHPFFRGARATLAVDNLFNERQNVTDANGATPLNYQPYYLDPQGRTVRLSFRKLF